MIYRKITDFAIVLRVTFRCLRTNVNNFASLVSENSTKSKRSGLKRNGYLYIKDASVAASIASHLIENWNKDYILEANPGSGILTCSILQKSTTLLRVFEKNSDFLPNLESLSSRNSCLEVVKEDLLLLPSLNVLSSKSLYEFSVAEIFFSNISSRSWKETGPCRLFFIVSNKRSIKFFRYLLAALSTRSCIFSFGRCEIFVLATESEYMYMKALPKENFSTYRWSTVLYCLFFDIKFLDKFPSDSLVSSCGTYKKQKGYGDNFYLIKLTPRPDLFSYLVPGNRLQDLYFFVRHHLIKRSALVIPTMESWIPSCGPRLIKEGMNVFTKFGDLSPNQILQLFNQFSSWPEYEDSTFQAALRQYQGRSFTFDEDDKSVTQS